MAGLLSCIPGLGPHQPATILTDTIIPFHTQDSTKVWSSVVLDLTLRFDDVLDIEKLTSALNRLFALPGWRKLGARIRRNTKTGKLEYHIPSQYTESRPAFTVTRAKHECGIEQHPVASQFPKAGKTPSVASKFADFRDLVRDTTAPKELNDFLYTDRPALTLHFVEFADATIVTITWIHCYMDAMGWHIFFRAWMAMLDGREDEIPAFHGWDFDPLGTLGAPVQQQQKGNKKEGSEEAKGDGDNEPEEFVLAHRKLQGLNMVKFALNMVYDTMAYKDDGRVVCIPGPYVQILKAEALAHLATLDPSSITLDTTTPTPTPFLSDADILLAWWSRLVMSQYPWSRDPAQSSRLISIMNIFDMRDVLSSTSPALIPPNHAVMHNAIIPIYTQLTVGELMKQPLAITANALRQNIKIQSTRPQIEAQSRIQNAAVKATGYPPAYGTPTTTMLAVSNWSKAKMYDVDFSSAVVGGLGDKEGGVKHVRGKPSFIQSDGFVKGLSMRGGCPVFGRDHNGDFWLGAILRVDVWEGIERALSGAGGVVG